MSLLWCLAGAALCCTILAGAALVARPPSLSEIRPGQALRGCTAIFLLLIAVGLVGMALLVTQR